MRFTDVVAVFAGGGTGCLLRWLAVSLIGSKGLPPYFATFFVNALGGLLIGLFFAHYQNNNDVKLLLITGLCGGFTTFSAFSLENYMFIKNQEYVSFLLYSLASVLLCVLSVFAGVKLHS